MPAVPVLGRLRQENQSEVNLGHMVFNKIFPKERRKENVAGGMVNGEGKGEDTKFREDVKRK